MITQEFVEQLNRNITVEGKAIVVDFFITFSRFECALKLSNFLHGDNERVTANWDGFIASIRPLFNKNNNDELHVAFDYILLHPPRIQMVQNNQQLGWRDRAFQDNDPEINRVSLSIRDVRNNLFHGGKFQGNFYEDTLRNFQLLKSALIVLSDWLRLSDNVRGNYLQPI